MRLTLISLFLCTSATFASAVNSQTARVDIHAGDVPASEIITHIEAQTQETLQNQKRITGTIVDSDGEPLIGANVAIKGGKEGTIADMNGQFNLNVAPGAILVISYIGYIPQEVTVGNRTSLSITLLPDLVALKDVIVVGYGLQTKATLTGAVSAITADELVTTKTGNVQNAIAGKVAGVKIAQRTSEPGVFNNEFSIRGMGTPLVVIDGVPRDNMPRLDTNEIESISFLKDASAAIYGTRAGNGVVLITTKKGAKSSKVHMEYNNYIGVEDFILKMLPNDAVGYMTLKNEQAYNNHQTTPVFPESQIDLYRNGTLQSQDWMMQFINNHPMEQAHNLSVSGGSDKVKFFTSLGYYKQEGIWVLKSSDYSRYNLRSNVTAEITKGLEAEVQIGLMKDHRNKQGEGTWRTLDGAWGQKPIDQVFIDGDKNYPGNASNNRHPYVASNPDLAGYNWYEERQAQTNLALNWDIPGVKGLKARGMYSYDYLGYEDKEFRRPMQQYNPDKTPGNSNSGYIPIARTYVGFTNTLAQISLNYDATFGSHHVSAMALYEESDRQADNFKAQRDATLFSVEELMTGSASTARAEQATGKELDENTNISVLHHLVNKAVVGRVAYDYESKYLAEVSFRYDGSSKFGSEHQWGLFPSFFGAWRLSEEAFIKDNAAWLNNLKLRASYGILGDDGNAQFQYYSGYNYPAGSGYVFGGKVVNGVTSRGVPNTNLTWIESKMLNIGLDAEAYNGLIGVTVDIWKRDRSGLMATRQVSLPGEIGATVAQENLNTDMSKGLELVLTHRNKIGSDFRYNVSINMALDRTINKYVERAADRSSYRAWRDNPTDRYKEIFWGYDYLGQYQTFDQIFTGPVYERGNAYMLPGDIMYGDWNEDGIIDGNDEHPLYYNSKQDSKMKPIMTYGSSIGATYKGFDFNMVIQGIGTAYRRNDAVDIFEWPLAGGNSNSDNGWEGFMDRWHRADETNPTKWQVWVPGKYPSVYRSNSREFNVKQSSFWIYNGAYMRVKSIELGYTLPQRITQKAAIEKARIFFNGFNLLTFTKVSMSDPEQPERYPLNRSYNFGVNVSF